MIWNLVLLIISKFCSLRATKNLIHLPKWQHSHTWTQLLFPRQVFFSSGLKLHSFLDWHDFIPSPLFRFFSSGCAPIGRTKYSLKADVHNLILPQFPVVTWCRNLAFSPLKFPSVFLPLCSNSFSLVCATLCYSVYLSFCLVPSPIGQWSYQGQGWCLLSLIPKYKTHSWACSRVQ